MIQALPKVKVRGIYSTAVTKLLLDRSFEIVQSSPTIKERFRLSENQEPPDFKINDRYDRQGVRVLGTQEAVEAFQSVLQSTLEDVVTRKWKISVDGVYKGKVIEADEQTIYIDIGVATGKLPRFEIVNSKQKQLVVQVERKGIGAKQPVLTTKLKVIGNHAILAQSSKTGVSLKIRDLNKRAELYALAKELTPNGWGIIWRGTSANQSKETLKNEVFALLEKADLLNERALRAKASTLLLEGLGFMDVEFPSISKRKLDALRASTTHTLDGHHRYKACGDKISAALEMGESLLEKGQDRSKVENLFRQSVMYEFPETGSLVGVEHVKLSGHVFYLGQATIEEFDDAHIKFSRIMRSSGFYDGLGVRKEAGDKAVSEAKIGGWSITTMYFSEDGRCKGTYVNINTPVEVYPSAIRYVDLEVDVCIQPDGTVKVLDQEKLEEALENGFINKKVFEAVRVKVKEVKKTNA
jgi:Ribonuclease G/E